MNLELLQQCATQLDFQLAVGFYLIAHLLFPEPIKGENLQDYYYGAMQPAW